MTAGSDLVFDHLSHNHIEPRAEYQFVLRCPFSPQWPVLRQKIAVCSWRDIIANIIIINIVAIIIIIIIYWPLCPSLAASARDLSSDRHSNREIPGTPAREERVCPLIETASISRHVENIHGAFIIATNRRGRQIAGDSKQNGLSFFTFP